MRIYYLFLLIPLFFSCESEEKVENTKDDDLLLITSGTTYGGSYNVNLMATDTLFEGYNKLYIDITKTTTNEEIGEANVRLMPMMHMVAMSHAAPVEQPALYTNENGYFEGAVVFLMPDNISEWWDIKVAIDANDEKDTVLLTIPKVKSLEEVRKINIISDIDERVYFVSLVSPADPQIGINDIEFTIHYRETMMSFPPDESVTITFEPEMPSMGHGSPNNVQPVHIGNGHYKGQINFTMTGWWRVNLNLKSGDQVISSDDSFDIRF